MKRMTLRALRVDAKLSQLQLAEALGVSLATIKNWESGKTFPKQPMIEKICEFFGVTYDFIRFE